ncbi:MAG: hypothetical protein ACPGU5_08455 [Lishizhenia sp.]
MKKIILLALLAITTNSFAQTKIIALKRHSAAIEKINNEKSHNFGNPNVRIIDTLEYLSNGKVVEKGYSTFQGIFSDTVKNHWNFENYRYSSAELEKMYGVQTVLLNLEVYEKERKKALKKPKKSSPRWLVLLLPLLLFVKPKKKMC